MILRAFAIKELGLIQDVLEKCPWTISTSMGDGTRYRHINMELSLKLNQDNVEDASFMKVKAIVTVLYQ